MQWPETKVYNNIRTNSVHQRPGGAGLEGFQKPDLPLSSLPSAIRQLRSRCHSLHGKGSPCYGCTLRLFGRQYCCYGFMVFHPAYLADGDRESKPV